MLLRKLPCLPRPSACGEPRSRNSIPGPRLVELFYAATRRHAARSISSRSQASQKSQACMQINSESRRSVRLVEVSVTPSLASCKVRQCARSVAFLILAEMAIHLAVSTGCNLPVAASKSFFFHTHTCTLFIMDQKALAVNVTLHFIFSPPSCNLSVFS